MNTKKPVNIENIYILNGTQVGNIELKRGVYLPPGKVFAVDHKYTSNEKTTQGQPVRYKITEEQAAELIQADQAIAVKKVEKQWTACNIFGDVIKDGPKIILRGSSEQPAAGGA